MPSDLGRDDDTRILLLRQLEAVLSISKEIRSDQKETAKILNDHLRTDTEFQTKLGGALDRQSDKIASLEKIEEKRSAIKVSLIIGICLALAGSAFAIFKALVALAVVAQAVTK